MASRLRPIEGETLEGNVEFAREKCRYVLSQGFVPIASHVMLDGILSEDVPGDREIGLACGIRMVATCDELWAFGRISEGMAAEIKEARRLGIPVVEFP